MILPAKSKRLIATCHVLLLLNDGYLPLQKQQSLNAMTIIIASSLAVCVTLS